MLVQKEDIQRMARDASWTVHHTWFKAPTADPRRMLGNQLCKYHNSAIHVEHKIRLTRREKQSQFKKIPQLGYFQKDL